METTLQLTEEKANYPLGTQLSFGLEGLINNFMLTAYNVRVFAFYQIVKKLDATMLAIAIFLYAVWNMINDPLVGYISDRNSKMLKYGRRFPLITTGILLIGVAYLLIFLVPGQNKWLILFWLVISSCLFDFLFSIWTTNYLSLMSVKFNAYTRKRVTVFNSIFCIFGLTLGMILPALLLFNDYDNQSSYILSAGIVCIITIFFALFMIPGIRETPGMHQPEELNANQPSFIFTLKQCLKSKNFIAHVMYTLGQGVLTTLVLGSLQYWNQYILESDQTINEVFVGGALLLGSLTAIPPWFKLSKKVGTRKTMAYGAALTCIFLLLFFFFGTTLTGGIIFALLIGASIGAMWTCMYVSFTDVITEFSVKIGTFSEGVWTGVRMFFNRISFLVQALSIGIIQNVTGFDQYAESQTEPAKMGLRIIMSLVPLFFYMVGGLLIWYVYDLTPEKMKKLYAEHKINGEE